MGGIYQPTESRPNRRNIFWGDGVQDVNDGGGRCCIVSTVELRGKKTRKTNFVVVLGGPQSTNKHNNQPMGATGDGYDRRETNGKRREDSIGSF
jgi:hypothetical protein